MYRLIVKGISTTLLTIAFLLSFSSFLYSEEDKNGNDFIGDCEKIYTLYFRDKLSDKEQEELFKRIELLTGIGEDGSLDRDKSVKTEILIKKRSNEIKKFCTVEDLISITGLNYIYFETATFYNKKAKFINYYEKGFYENKDFYTRGKRYYRILYFYLVNTQDGIIGKINKAISLLNKDETKNPDFSPGEIKRLENIIKTSNEIMRFIKVSEEDELSSGLNFSKVFDSKEKEWIKSTAGWFTNIDNFLAIYSYEWFRKNLPKSVSTALISDMTAFNWEKQSILQRKRLPLVFFKEEEKEYSTNIDDLFENTIKYLKFNNRQIDIIVVSALKSWLSKQIKQGVNVEDRLKYKNILEELNVSPSGWIFYNLYECRKRVAELKKVSRGWGSKSSEDKDKIFNSMVQKSYYQGKDNLDNIFAELKTIFGSPSMYGDRIKKNSVNYIFHRYKGELNYYYENIFFKWVTDLSKDSVKVPATEFWKDSVYEFRAAFIKEPSKPENHENLLKAYNLFMKELQYNGNIVKITNHWNDFIDLVKNNSLGSVLPSKKNNTYDILHIFANTFLRSTGQRERALDISIKSFSLADNYYRMAAEKYGFVNGKKTGALNNKCTEIDDYQREFEFLKMVAEKSGKKIQLILDRDKITLYNKLIAQN